MPTADELLAELRGLLCPDGDTVAVLAAAVRMAKRRVVVEVQDGAKRARFEGGSVDEVNRLMGHDTAEPEFEVPDLPVTLTEAH